MKHDTGKCFLKLTVIEHCKKHMIILTAIKDNAGGGAICSLSNTILGKNRGCSPPKEGKRQLPTLRFKIAFPNDENMLILLNKKNNILLFLPSRQSRPNYPNENKCCMLCRISAEFLNVDLCGFLHRD